MVRILSQIAQDQIARVESGVVIVAVGNLVGREKIVGGSGTFKNRSGFRNMPRFYINFRNGDHVAFDDEGVDLQDIEAARRMAVLSAKELIGEAIKHDGSTVPDAVIVCDASGSNLLTLSIADILSKPLGGL
jgi:hypothetical protein